MVPVIKVTADLARRGEGGGELETLPPQRRRRQHAGLKRRGSCHLVGALRDHRLEPLEVGAVFELEASASKGIDAGEVELRGSHRLDVVAIRAVVDGCPTQLWIVYAGDHRHRRLWNLLVQLAQQPVAGLVGQADVHEHERIVDSLETQPGFRAGEGDVGVEAAAAQRPRHRLRQRLLVLDDQEPLPITSVSRVHCPGV